MFLPDIQEDTVRELEVGLLEVARAVLLQRWVDNSEGVEVLFDAHGTVVMFPFPATAHLAVHFWKSTPRPLMLKWLLKR